MLIQLGAILALLSIYFTRLWRLALGFFTDAQARRFVIGVLIAFLPAAVVGAIAHDFIKSVLFNPWIVCFTLIAGGAVLLWVDRIDLKARYDDATDFSLPMYLGIGLMPVRVDDPGRVALRRDHRRRHADGRRPPRRRRNFRSGWRCRRWSARSPTISTRDGAHLSGDNKIIIAVGFVTLVRVRLDRGQDVSRLRLAPRLRRCSRGGASSSASLGLIGLALGVTLRRNRYVIARRTDAR